MGLLTLSGCTSPGSGASQKVVSPDTVLMMVKDSVLPDSLGIGQHPDSLSRAVRQPDSIPKHIRPGGASGAIKEAPKHDAPDQMKIDSIKKEKAKLKKGEQD